MKREEALKDYENLFLGIDIGSVSVNFVILDEEGNILDDSYNRTNGKPLEVVCRLMSEILSRLPEKSIKGIATTGSGGKLVAELLKGAFVNEVVAHSRSITRLYPEVRTLVEMGGEDSKLLIFKKDEEQGKIILEDFSMNTLCAAGTGSFLDQQASRMGVAIEGEFGELALKSKQPPRIAGRCSVFAKSDMIHLQQIATPDYDIIAGLCYAVARNFKSNIGKGKRISKPIAFQGGVAANMGVVKAFEDILDLKPGELIIPKHFPSMGAIGAVFSLMETETRTDFHFKGLEKMEEYLQSRKLDKKSHPPLGFFKERDGGDLYRIDVREIKEHEIPVKAYLGIDVGSLSTNLAVIDRDINILARRYLPTAGRPIEAIRRGLDEIGAEVGDKVEIIGVGTTGSGRYLTGDFVGADVVRNEITAQATASIHFDPEVDTIFEIGGQDSKYISLSNGAVVDFEMNKVCAAGTGSFLEEQAEKLNINIKEEFGEMALNAENPVPLGERCTVFMESDLVSNQQQGGTVENLVAGLAYSIVYNYLNKVVGDRRIGNKIFYQGGVTWNKGVVAAFEQVLGKRIHIPPHHDITGAIGVALIAMREMTGGKSNFKGFDLSKKKYSLSTFTCNHCSNSCEIRKVNMEDSNPLFYGARCDRYEIGKDKKSRGEDLPDLFHEREKLLFGEMYDRYTSYLTGQSVEKTETPEDSERSGPIIGIPRLLFYFERLPYWLAFFKELGLEVVISDPTNKKLIHRAVETVVAESCFPVKVAHGHILDLIDKNVDYIFLPSIISMEKDDPRLENNRLCPYVQTIPYIIRSAINLEKEKIEMLSPILDFHYGRKEIESALKPLAQLAGAGKGKLKKAIQRAEEAQKVFADRLIDRGEEILKNLKPGEKALVVISRPYNGYDQGMNLELAKILNNLGIVAMPMDMLDIRDVDISDDWENMYWKYGQKILKTARIIQNDPRLYAVYVTNFSCGPDSFLLTFFNKIMDGKPALQLEIDEHSAAAGVITRCEAFLESLGNVKEQKERIVVDERIVPTAVSNGDGRTLWIPYMCEHAHTFAAAFRASGIDGQVLPPSDDKSLELGRKYTTGKECFPLIVTTGDMIKKVMEPGFDKTKAAFFMPSGTGPCRFGHYNTIHKFVLKELGLEDVPIIAPNQGTSFYKELGSLKSDPTRKAWQGLVATDILEKALLETRPYEVNPGETDLIFKKCLERVCSALVSGDVFDIMKDCLHDFKQIKVDKSVPKPIIGIVGEIFSRFHTYSNQSIVRKLESFGAEVRESTFGEWIYYINFTNKRTMLKEKTFSAFLKTLIKDKVQKIDEEKLMDTFKDFLIEAEEPSTKELLENAEPYLHHSYEGEAVVSLGKAIDFFKQDIHGVVNIMPFTCMPGTIVSAIIKKLREDHKNFPMISMVYDGQEDLNAVTRIEAFVHQARQYQEMREKKPVH